ncbi:MAG TPA: hypothetical protein VKZ50_11465 [bacterium]|nr:hypothetical protein [bacterium]
MSGHASPGRAPLYIALGLGAIGALAALLLPGAQALLGMIAAAVAVLALLNTRIALYLIVPAMVLSPDLPMHGVAVRSEDLMMVPLVIGWLAHLCVSKMRRQTPFDRILIAYALVGILATVWGSLFGTVHLLTVNKYESSPLHMLKRVEFVALFLIAADTLETLSDVRKMVYVLLGSMVALSLYSLWQYHTNQSIAVGPEGAPYHEPGMASMVAVALALGLMRSSTPTGRVILGGIMMFAIATLPLALGRNYIVATLLILLYVGVKEQRWLLFAVPAIAALALLVYPEGVAHRIVTLQSVLSPDTSSGPTSTASASVFYRAQAPIYYALWALGTSPLLGLGMGSVPLGAIDSEYVTQLFYTGLIGLAIFVIFSMTLFRVIREMSRAATDPVSAGLVQGLGLIVVGYAFYSVFAASISATHTGSPFFVVVAVIGVLYRVLVPASVTETPRERIGSRRSYGGERHPLLLPGPAPANPWGRLRVLRQTPPRPQPEPSPPRTRRELWTPLRSRPALTAPRTLSGPHG